MTLGQLLDYLEIAMKAFNEQNYPILGIQCLYY